MERYSSDSEQVLLGEMLRRLGTSGKNGEIDLDRDDLRMNGESVHAHCVVKRNTQLNLELSPEMSSRFLKIDAWSMAGDIILGTADEEASFGNIVLSGNVLNADIPRDIVSANDLHPKIHLATALDSTFSLRFKACNAVGPKGFFVQFSKQEDGGYFVWEIKDSSENSSCIYYCFEGKQVLLASARMQYVMGSFHDCILWVSDGRITTFVDGRLDHSIQIENVGQ